jgi:hypothetical protein
VLTGPSKKILLRYVVVKRKTLKWKRFLGRLFVVVSFDSGKSRNKSTLSKKAYNA